MGGLVAEGVGGGFQLPQRIVCIDGHRLRLEQPDGVGHHVAVRLAGRRGGRLVGKLQDQRAGALGEREAAERLPADSKHVVADRA